MKFGSAAFSKVRMSGYGGESCVGEELRDEVIDNWMWVFYWLCWDELIFIYV